MCYGNCAIFMEEKNISSSMKMMAPGRLLEPLTPLPKGDSLSFSAFPQATIPKREPSHVCIFRRRKRGTAGFSHG